MAVPADYNGVPTFRFSNQLVIFARCPFRCTSGRQTVRIRYPLDDTVIAGSKLAQPGTFSREPCSNGTGQKWSSNGKDQTSKANDNGQNSSSNGEGQKSKANGNGQKSSSNGNVQKSKANDKGQKSSSNDNAQKSKANDKGQNSSSNDNGQSKLQVVTVSIIAESSMLPATQASSPLLAKSVSKRKRKETSLLTLYLKKNELYLSGNNSAKSKIVCDADEESSRGAKASPDSTTASTSSVEEKEEDGDVLPSETKRAVTKTSRSRPKRKREHNKSRAESKKGQAKKKKRTVSRRNRRK